jgi:LacI family transcriptional regulator
LQPTIRDISRNTGFSIGTVDRALHNRPGVSRRTADRVLDAARHLGYKPNVLASRLKANDAVRAGILMPHTEVDNAYWRLIKRGILRAASELRAYNFRIAFYHYSPYQSGSFQTAGERLLAEKVQGAAVVPISRDPMTPVLSVLDREVPYIILDVSASDADPFCFVGQDPVHSGRVAGEMLSLLTGGKGTAVVVQTALEQRNLSHRRTGFQETYSGRYMLAGPLPDESPRALRRLMSALPVESPSGFCVLNAAVGRLVPYIAERYPRRPPVIGYDLTTRNRKALAAGLIDILINQRPETQGAAAVYALYRRLITRESVQTSCLMPVDIITPRSLPVYRDDPARLESNIAGGNE